MASNVKKLSKLSVTGISLLLFIISFCASIYAYGLSTLPESDNLPGTLSIHFLTLGNEHAGDCIYIQNGDVDILVDGGSKTTSLNTIVNYIKPLMQDDVLDYAIVTHAHEDHIACFAGTNAGSLFTNFKFGTIIDFPNTNKTSPSPASLLGKYKAGRTAEINEGAKHFTALECYNNEGDAKRIYDLGLGVELEILYNAYYVQSDSSDENNYSVCFQINHNSKHFLFTGDLEKEGEEKLVENNSLTQVELFKAGHHGSNTANSSEFLNVIKPKICVATCVAGYPEYTSNPENIFPSTNFLNNISSYTSEVYITSQGYKDANGDAVFSDMNGNIVITSENNNTKIECSNSTNPLGNKPLKYWTGWFEFNNRKMPSSWAV